MLLRNKFLEVLKSKYSKYLFNVLETIVTDSEIHSSYDEKKLEELI